MLITPRVTEQKYALVTGASSGIGYAMVKALSKKGYRVFACAPKSVAFLMKPLADEYGAITFDCDITNLDDIKNTAELINTTTQGRLDVLYNNAGISIGGPAIEIDENKLDKLFQVNVIGHINMTKHLAPLVINAKGVIVFTSSVASIIPLAWVSAYNATKAAINMYAKTLESEVKPLGVKVYSVITGGVDTAICDNNRVTTIDSEYYNVEGIFDSLNSSANMSRNRRTTEDPDVYAEGIVKKITRRDSGFNIFKGAKAYTLYLVSLYVPLFLIQFGNAFHFKQLKVWYNMRKALKARESKKSK